MESVGISVGPVPSWLALGPTETIEGLPAREVLGDWSHLLECDRPPKYLRPGTELIHNNLSGWDRSETREAIKQSRPGKPIVELKGRHSGKVTVLFNGGSLHEHDLHKIKTPIIGMNRTHVGYPGYDGPQPDYLCVIDWAWFDRPKWKRTILTHPCIVNGSDHREDIGYRATRHPRFAPFSFDLARDGYAGPIPCSTGHLALQLAVFMGFTEIHCLGWDMGGKHFDGTRGSYYFRDAIAYHKRQAPLLKERGISVYVCGSPDSKVEGFERSDFSAVC